MKDFIVQHFFKALEIVVKFTGKIHMPWTKKIMNAEQIREIISKAKAGDVLVVRSGGNFSSLLLGEFSHTAIVMNGQTILDATDIGVARRDILSVAVGYTRVTIMRPKFTATMKRKAMNRAVEIEKADEGENIPYNYSLVNGNEVSRKIPDALTCSQLTRDILNHGKENFMDLRKRFGFMSIAPEDFYKARTKFDLVYDSEK